MALEGYRSVALGRRQAAYARSAQRRLGTIDLCGLSTGELWTVHNKSLAAGRLLKDGPSLLEVKIELSRRMLRNCSFCERRCGVDRTVGQGFCGVGECSHYFLEKILWGEERPLIPSHEVFFSGCNMRCKFCYSWESLLNASFGTQIVPGELAGVIARRRREGAVNVNLIGGEPTVHLTVILESLRLLETPTAVVWNSNFYMSEETMRLLIGVVDLYLGDFRFGNDECADGIAGTRGYCEAASRNFKIAAETGDLIIRHLLLPGHVECCLRPIAEWVAANLPEVPFNLMFQYMPFFEALHDSALCRALTPEEEEGAAAIVSSLGLNTERWNTPLGERLQPGTVSSGEIKTIITVRPDGKVGIMHLHKELLDLVQALELGGK